MRVIFAGTPEFALPALHALMASQHTICAVYTQPDRPAGRGQQVRASPVKQLAQQTGLPVFQPKSLRLPETIAELASHDGDLMVVAAYGLILPRAVLDIPKLGCINIHASLLPRWRGAAPIQRAILAGDQVTGITIMRMEEGLDTGPMLHKSPCPIQANDTAQTLQDRLAELGAEALREVLPEIEAGRSRSMLQEDSLATYAPKIEKKEAKISWEDSALVLARKIRAFNPWPVAETLLEGKSLRIWQAQPVPELKSAGVPGTVVSSGKSGIDVATGAGILRITELQQAGKRRMNAAEFLNAHMVNGLRLGAN